MRSETPAGSGDVAEKAYLGTNRKSWDDRVEVHFGSDFYDVAGFKAGNCSLKSVEVEELGDIAGKSLLHLQCHFGLDSLSLARRGAHVTGVDFSEQAISTARRLNEEECLGSHFICSNVYELPQHLDERFDIVFTSYGVLCWLPDMRRWAAVIERFLKPGGLFYIVEHHMLGNMFDNEESVTCLRVTEPYFHSREPYRYVDRGTYATTDDETIYTNYEWIHSMSDIINSLIGVGLQIEFVHEFPFIGWRAFPVLERDCQGWWRMPAGRPDVPLMFSIRATRPE